MDEFQINWELTYLIAFFGQIQVNFGSVGSLPNLKCFLLTEFGRVSK